MVRYKAFLFICFIGIFSNSDAQVLSEDYINYKWEADSLYKTENYAAAVGFYRRICDLPSFIPRYDYYYTACCYAKIDKPDSALQYLEKGAKKGERFSSKKAIDSDKTLMLLHQMKRWDTIRNMLYDNTDMFLRDPSRNDSIYKVLLDLRVKDQRIRLQMMHDSNWEATYQAMSKADRDSSDHEFDTNDMECEIVLKKIIDKFGWPGLKMVGSDGEEAAWLVAQHSDGDTTFQVFCFKKMMAAMLNYDSQLNNIAYLQDRILLHEGKEQIYGTQFRSDGTKLVPRPIRDEKNVDKWRHAVGLPSLETYLSNSAKYFNDAKKK